MGMVADMDIEDFKQLMTAVVVQNMSHLATKRELSGLATKVSALGRRIDTLDEKTDIILETLGDYIEDHEQRLTRLEARAA